MKTKMKVCHVGHSKTVLCHKQKDNSFSTTVPLFSFSPNNLQTHDQIIAANETMVPASLLNNKISF